MNYKKVIADFNNGSLDPEKVTLVMDNDGGYWEYTSDDAVSDEEHDRIIEALEKKYGEPGGYRDIVDVLKAAGVKCEWC